jgi:hypothetical protein
MVRSVVSKVMWVGRVTVFFVGLAVILAVVFGVASAAFGANGGNFILGSLNNTATAITKLTGNVSGGPALHVVNSNTASGSKALQLNVAQGKPPLAVNSTAGKATNLNADKLDGNDSSALGITTDHNRTVAFNCAVKNASNECGKIQVVVPTGKQYIVDVWSSINWAATGGSAAGIIEYCSAMNSGSGPQCITPFGEDNRDFIPFGEDESESSSGQTGVLGPGTYTFSTLVVPQTDSVSGFGAGGRPVITKVLVRDASNPGPTGVTVQ